MGCNVPIFKYDPFRGCDGKTLDNDFLRHQLGVAIEHENYEWAAQIRDELARRDSVAQKLEK